MKQYHPKLAFSLIELSIVILIVGVLVVGITKGSRIVRASKLKSAQILTAGSPVNSMDNLVIWVESTSDKSFISGQAVDTPTASQGTISTWNNIGSQAFAPSPAQSGAASLYPRYMLNRINNLPVVNFDGTDDHLSFNGTFLANSDFTVFVVEQRKSNQAFNMFIGTNAVANQKSFFMGYRTDTTFEIDFYNFNSYFITVPTFNSLSIPRLHSYRHGSLGINYNMNGRSVNIGPCITTCVQSTHLLSNDNAAIGRMNTNYFNGDIGEIIIFNRYVTDNERTSVETYLKNKWGIK